MGKMKKVEKKASKVAAAKAPVKKMAVTIAQGKAPKSTATVGKMVAPISKSKIVKSKAQAPSSPKTSAQKAKAEPKILAKKNLVAKQVSESAKKAAVVMAPSKTKAREKSELQAVLTKKADQSRLSKEEKAPAPIAPPAAPLDKKQKKLSAAAARKAAEAQEDLTNAGKKWLGLYNQLKNSKTKPYDMSASFDIKSGIQHQVLGWGYVVETRGDRMDVLFKDGMKTLVINYMKA